MISVEADIKPTIDKLLPRLPQLIPVSLKRKLEYKGNYIEEMVDTQKVILYFDYFKKNNPLVGDQIMTEERIEEVIQSLLPSMYVCNFWTCSALL